MPRRLLLREGSSKKTPSGFISISSKDGQLKTEDDKGASKPVSASGERFLAKGEVFKGELVYLNTDGTVSIPGNITDDDNKADNIIGIFLSDAADGELVSIVTKGIISLDVFNFESRTVYYIDSKGKLTTSTTPYIFGKSLNSSSIMIEISFMQSILNRYGIVPTFDRLVAVWNSSTKGVELSWSTDDSIVSFEIASLGIIYRYETPLSNGSSIILSDDIEKYGLQNLSYYVGSIKNEKESAAEFEFQIKGIDGDDNSSISYSYLGLGEQYNKGVGLFKNTNIFANVKIEIILYADGTWSFGDSNVLPIRKLFGFSGVEKDEDGQYVTVVFKDLDIKLYESENWVNSNNFITNDYSYSPSATINWFKNALAKADWDGTMKLTTNGEIKVGSKIYYSRKSGEYVEIPVDRKLYLYDSKNVYLLGEKSIIESISDLKFVDFSSTTKAEKDTISKSFDKYSSTEFEFTGSFLFATIGDLTLNETIYYISLKDKLESLGIIGLTMNLFNGSQTVTVSSKGIITKIVDVTTTTTTQQNYPVVTFTKSNYGKETDNISDYLNIYRGDNGGIFNLLESDTYGDSFAGGITHLWASEPLRQSNVFVSYTPVGLPDDVSNISIYLSILDSNNNNLLSGWSSYSSWAQSGSNNVSPSIELPINRNISLKAFDNANGSFLDGVTFENITINTDNAQSFGYSYWYDDIWNTFDINSIDVDTLISDIEAYKNSSRKIDPNQLSMIPWNFSVSGIPPLSLDRKMIMFDVYSGDFYKVEFKSWTQGGKGGGFSYERQLLGSIVPPTTTTKRPYDAVLTLDDKTTSVTGNLVEIYEIIPSNIKGEPSSVQLLDTGNFDENGSLSIYLVDVSTQKTYLFKAFDTSDDSGNVIWYDRVSLSFDDFITVSRNQVISTDITITVSTYEETLVNDYEIFVDDGKSEIRKLLNIPDTSGSIGLTDLNGNLSATIEVSGDVEIFGRDLFIFSDKAYSVTTNTLDYSKVVENNGQIETNMVLYLRYSSVNISTFGDVTFRLSKVDSLGGINSLYTQYSQSSGGYSYGSFIPAVDTDIYRLDVFLGEVDWNNVSWVVEGDIKNGYGYFDIIDGHTELLYSDVFNIDWGYDKSYDLNQLITTTTTTTTLFRPPQDFIWQNIVQSGLIMNFDFNSLDSFDGSNTINDLIGNYTGTITGASYDSSNGGHLVFDGNDYISTNYIQSINESEDFTWDVWFNAISNTPYPIIGNRYSPPGQLNFMKFTSVNLEYWSDVGPDIQLSNFIATGFWTNATIVKQGNVLKYYFNKNLIQQFTGVTTAASNKFWIGGDADYGEYSSSRISTVRVYNRALTDQEIIDNFTITSARFS